MYLDFAKAFDTVPHARLILKLEAYGVCNTLIEWVKSFLSERKQRVVRGDAVSDWVSVTSGVPQGSVLGPVLFVIYVNDLPRKLKCECKLFADDSKILADVSTNQGAKDLQHDLDVVKQWESDWLLRLNSKKCHVLHFGKKNPQTHYHLTDPGGNVPLAVSSVERDLGVYISNNLKWEVQCDKVVAKANRMLGIMRNTFVNRKPFIWKRLYTAYVRPHVEYAVQAWRPYLSGDIDKIERVQRRATRIALGDGVPYEERCAILGLESLESRRERGDLIQAFKVFKGFSQVNWVKDLATVPGRCGQRDQLRGEPVNDCDRRRFFFLNRIVDGWNKLPDEVVDSCSVNQFKIRLDKCV